MADWMQRHGLARPLFDYVSDYFVVTMLGRERSGGLNPQVARQLTARQQEVLLALGRRGRLTARDCAEQLGVDRNAALRDLKTLVGLGFAEPRGSGRSRYYVLGSVV
jgi:predicted HTH transcriptional regulator